MVMKGLTWTSLKKHYSLMPLFAITAFGLALPVAYVIRLAVKNPDVTWTKSNPEPWQDYADKHYKLYRTKEIDFKKYSDMRPKF